MKILVLIFTLASGFIIGFDCEDLETEMNKNMLLAIIEQLNKPQQKYCDCVSRYGDFKEQSASSLFDIRFDTLPEECQTETVPKNCAEATSCTRRSGIYKILLEKYSSKDFPVECDVKTEGGDWTLIQRRLDGSVDFYRDWAEYKNGFGQIDGEFFIGLDKLHALTNYNGPQELLVLLHDKNETRKAFYSNFVVGPEDESYPLKHVGAFSGDAGDSLTQHMGEKFSTKDQDNDVYSGNCAQRFTGAWWYKKCHTSNLNGKYGDKTFGKGVNWLGFRNRTVSIEHVTMMIRRRSF